jgi:putative ABC transport system ATP-binding protein
VLVASTSFDTPLPASIGLHAEAGEAAEAFARALARQMPYSGSIRIGATDIGAAPRAALTGSLAYVGPEPVIFHGTIRENVVYGLNRRDPGQDGSPADWLDWEAAGASGPDDLDGRIVQALSVCGLDDAVYRAGLGGLVDPKAAPDLARMAVEARGEVVRRLEAGGASALVERFDEKAYNTNATLGENLLFGSPSGKDARERLPVDERLRRALDELDLSRPLAAVGLRIASTMVDIFADLPPDHFLFEQFSFISAEDLPDFARIVSRLERGEEPSEEEAGRLIDLAFDYVEPRHRLGLLTPDLERGVLAARPQLRRRLPDGLSGMIEFFDPDGYMAHAPLRDNILFGRIAYGVPGAEAKVLDVVRGTVADLGLIGEVYRLGLSTPAGYGGRLLSPAQRAGVALARALVTRPQVLVVDDALATFGAVERAAATARLVEATKGRTLVMVVRDPALLRHFEARVHWNGGTFTGVDEASSEGAAVVAGRAG